MTYNANDIRDRVEASRDRFIKRTVIDLILTAVAVMLIIFFRENVTVFFLSVVGGLTALVPMIFRLLSEDRRIIFSGEVVGINIKEHEFVATGRPGIRLGGGRYAHTPRPSYTGVSGSAKRTKPQTGATVYLRLESGEVAYLGGLSGAQTDVYDIGDRLYKFPGTKYPIILDRPVKAQPCPICGTVNRDTEPRCLTCGLEIDK